MRNFCRGKKHGRCIRTSGRAGAAADAGCRFHGKIDILFWNRDGIRFRCRTGPCGNETARLHDAIERASVDHQILNDRK